MNTTFWQLRVYRVALRLLPRDFHARYADEMELLFSERLADESTAKWPATAAECCNVMLTSVRVRLGRQPMQAPALIALMLLLAFVPVPRQQTTPRIGLAPMDSVDFVASDPAGEFTLHLRYGRAVGGTIDQYRLSRNQLVQTADSIRVLNPHGRVLFAVSYNRDAARIQWAARPAACRGRALECGAVQ
jgi:hypothetical protein